MQRNNEGLPARNGLLTNLAGFQAELQKQEASLLRDMPQDIKEHIGFNVTNQLNDKQKNHPKFLKYLAIHDAYMKIADFIKNNQTDRHFYPPSTETIGQLYGIYAESDPQFEEKMRQAKELLQPYRAKNNEIMQLFQSLKKDLDDLNSIPATSNLSKLSQFFSKSSTSTSNSYMALKKVYSYLDNLIKNDEYLRPLQEQQTKQLRGRGP